MRWTILLVAATLLAAGCLSGGSSPEAGEPASTDEAENATEAGNATPANASDNATYLKNDDYNRTHVHDYWPGNATEKTLMDESIQTDVFYSTFYTVFSPFIDEPRTNVGTVYFSLPNGSFVPEGTGNLIVEVDATSALERGQQALAYKPANAAEYTELSPQGAEATWRIDVSPEMVDLPHAKSTDWAFRLEADGHGAVLDGEIHVRITAEKTRDLDAWPAHDDFWEKGHETRRPLANINETFDRTRTFVDRFQGEQEAITFPEGTIVPPQTETLLLKFWWGEDGDPRNHVNVDVDLRVKEGSSSTWYGYQEHRVVQEREQYKMYAIPVDGSSWDSPYAQESAWGMQLNLQTGTPDPTGEGRNAEFGGLVEAGSGNATIDATAFRVTPPWLEQMMAEEGVEDDDAARG